MIIFFVLIGSAAFFWLVIEIWKRMEKYDNSSSPKAQQVRECLEKQALKHDGVILVDENTLRPELSFSHDKIKITVSICLGKNPVTYTTFQSDFFPDRDFRIANKRFKAVISLSKIKDFSSKLFPRFDIEGNSASFVEKLLT